jgi:decaprenylphospho-beta-D-erythro-pentofuranosid-2-ulose 2-reductase
MTATGNEVAADPEVSVAMPRSLLLIGGSSDIGVAIARRLAAEGPLRVYLLGRDQERLAAAAATLAGGAETEVGVVDADDVSAHAQAIDTAFARLGSVDLIVLAVGVLGAQAGLEAPADEALEVMRVNFVGGGSLLLHSLRRLREQGRGTLVVLSSVAAERARSGNAIYGAAKAGLDALAQGLADSLAGSGVRVLVVRPGFVLSRMTAGLKVAPMATTPDAVAQATVQALAGRAHTVWVPAKLRLVFMILRHLPRALYRRLPI